MRNRRITLLVLLVITCLALLDGRLGLIPHDRGTGITFTGWDNVVPHATVEREVILPADGLEQLLIEAQAARVIITGAETDSVAISAVVYVSASAAEEVERYLENFDIDASIEGNTAVLRAELPQELPRIGTIQVVYQVVVPQDLFVSAFVQQGLLEMSDLSGGLNLDVKYSGASGNSLAGGITADVDYGSVELQRVAGQVELQTSYSAVELGLLDVSAGYTFNLEAAYGTLGGNIKLDRQENNALTTARGVVNDGEYPVTVSSRFSTVEINIEK